ncbi:DUF3558 domain-containing protein [Saccharothrix coeruleofusca]|uniref:DUF3558 domain-containing protein n=1 Tax=Saccharothrix coeruleofusca TaxID=33919 RepID=UPI0016717C15|nr:DUF3558 domain-containing protein [Saccharothrix coeruleofusca]
MAVAGLAAGCSAKDHGQAAAESTTSTTITTTSWSKSTPGSAVPELDLSNFAYSPCDLLKADQLSQLGTFKAPEVDDSPLGPGCRWKSQKVTEGPTYAVTLSPQGNTLESMMENARSEPVFKETTVLGYRAFSSDQTNGKGTCSTTVGTSSEDAVVVHATTLNESSPEYGDTCAASEKFATLVVTTLKG